MARVNIPDAAVDVGWHEFRYPRPATEVPSEAFKRGVQAAAPLIVAAELERNVNELESWGWAEAADMLRKRVAELRGGAS